MPWDSVKNQPKISGCVRTRPQGTEHGAGKRRSRGAEVAAGKSQRPQNARGGCGIAQQLHAGQAVTVVLGGQQEIPPGIKCGVAFEIGKVCPLLNHAVRGQVLPAKAGEFHRGNRAHGNRFPGVAGKFRHGAAVPIAHASVHFPQTNVMGHQQRPVIAILTANVLVGVGLRSILEKAAPAADVELFGNFQEFAEADPERFIHYFVTAQLFAAHNAFFRARSHRTIVLANGQTPAGVHCIDVQTDEERFVRSLMRLQHSVRRPEHALPVQPQAAQPLTEREAEVLTLIAGGLINKQVADRLGIGLTTVISHRRNIMEKLGIRTAAGLVVYALAAGYVDPDGM